VSRLALVTGGAGFLGRAVGEALLADGWRVRSISRGAHAELRGTGIEHESVDLADAAAVLRAAEGCEAVFHVAARTGVWGDRADFVAANVTGTESVLAACRAHGIGRFVLTSSPSVCFDGRDHVRASNDLPLARRFDCVYPETKAEAERLVLAANGPDLATCALRPHLIFGPRDPHLIPRVLDRARRRRLAVIGDGTNEVSLTYVENAAWAHVDAARTLAPGAPHAGKAYFVAQEEPVRLWEWIDELLTAVDLPRVERRVSRRLAAGVGGALEFLWGTLRLRGEPPMTRFVAAQLATSHSYDLEPAKRDFGYVQRVSSDEAMQRLIAWVRAEGLAGSPAPRSASRA